MNSNMVASIMKQKRNGVWFGISWTTDLPMTAAAKKMGYFGTKSSYCQCRKGVDYDHQKSVQEKVAAGKVLTHELPWGEWKKGQEGVMITHKGKDYLRVYMGPNKPRTTYFINGREYTKEELRASGLVQESFFKPKEKPDCLTVKTENINAIVCKKKK